MSSRNTSVSAPRTALVALLTIPFVYPFVFLLFTAIRGHLDYLRHPFAIPRSFTGANFAFAWNTAGIGRALGNSGIAVGSGVMVCCAVSSTAAYWLYRHPGRFGGLLVGLLAAALACPWVVWLIPMFVLVSQIGLANNLFVLGVVYAAINVPFATWLMLSYFKQGLPREILEASRVDGASLVQEFARVVVPSSLPGLATVAALMFVYMWGDLLFAVILLQDSSKFTVVPAAATLVAQFLPRHQESAAAALISIVPMLAVFLFAQRAIVRGFTAGVGK